MTKDQAIEAMKEGNSIFHENFSNDEWMKMECGMIVFEDGCRCTPAMFWHGRDGESWDEGYSVIDTSKQGEVVK